MLDKVSLYPNISIFFIFQPCIEPTSLRSIHDTTSFTYCENKRRTTRKAVERARKKITCLVGNKYGNEKKINQLTKHLHMVATRQRPL